MTARLSKEQLQKKLSRIKLFVTDFDGVHTDGCVYVSEDGKEMVKCSRRDGMGINLLQKIGIHCVIISKESNSVVAARARKLKMDCYQKVLDSEGKMQILKGITSNLNLLPENVLYMGDDVNDRSCLEEAGVGVSVSDGHASLDEVISYRTSASGGRGAIREVAEMILKAQGHEIKF